MPCSAVTAAEGAAAACSNVTLAGFSATACSGAATYSAKAPYPLSELKLRDVSAYRYNLPRDVSPEDLVLWPAQPCREPDHKRVAAQEMPVTGICGGRMNVY
jgi:hypothetical protein